ncbi:MAG: GTP-binding protein [Bacteroidota bacterium]
MKKIPFILVTGFLGSGKTSLLIDLLRKHSGSLRMAIVQNEYSPGHTDGITLKKTENQFGLLEINNGSVFCACLLTEFIDRLEPFIREYQPDVILLEATGLADPLSIGQILQSEKLSDTIYFAASWCVIDALNFNKIIDTVSRSRHQVRIADRIWINKTDLVSDTGEIREKITRLNPGACITETQYGATDPVDFLTLIHEATELPPAGISHESEPRPDIGSCVVRSNRFFNESEVIRFIRDYAPGLYRMKGYIRIDTTRTLIVQTVFSDIFMEPAEGYEGATELIAIGPGLINREFSKHFLSLQKPFA